MPTPVRDPRATQRAARRRAVLQLVIGVILLDAVAMSVFYLADIQQAPSRTRTIFIITWSVATALLVAILLRRVRVVRMANRR